jgi:hypothetical protein
MSQRETVHDAILRMLRELGLTEAALETISLREILELRSRLISLQHDRRDEWQS